MMVRTNIRISLVTVLGLAVAGCYSGTDQLGSGGIADGGGTDDGADEGLGSDGGEDADSFDGGDPPEPPDCLPGAVGCECLDGGCGGLGSCRDDVCIPGPPIPETDGSGNAIAGIAIVLEGDIDGGEIAGYEQLEWSQVEGPTAAIDYVFDANAEAVAYLPSDAEPGTAFVFRLSATLGEVVASADYRVTIVDATPLGPMDEAEDVIALAGTAFSDANDGYWISDAAGMLSQVQDGAVTATYDLSSPIADIVRYANNLVIMAQPELGVLTQFNANNNMAGPFVTELSGGAPLGTPSAMVVDRDDNIYIGTGEGTILFYNGPDGTEPATTIEMETVGAVPTALALGEVPVSPDHNNGDEGNVLFIGTDGGNVVQIGLSAAEVPDDTPIGSVSSYITVPGSGPVTGLTIDDAGNMYVGKSSGIYIVQRAFEAAPVVVRTLAPTAGLEGFDGLRTRNGDVLVWIDSTSGRIGQLATR